MNACLLAPALFVFSTTCFALTNDNDEDKELIEKIEVTGEVLADAQEIAPIAIEIITSEQLNRLGSSHLQDVLPQLGNVNFSGGSSRTRFIQIRGIGERSQFVDSVIPSVGIAIDGIDYSGLGAIASTFDIQRLELLKGPQDYASGANAIAGYLNLYSMPPSAGDSSKLMMELGNYGWWNLGAAYTGNWHKDHQFRVSLNRLKGDGYIENDYLNRDNTNGFDELAIRANTKSIINDDWAVTTVVHVFDIDNGYDAFSFDNSRSTMTDQPGYDRQETYAFGITSYYRGFRSVNNKVFLAAAKSDTDFAFDQDWAHPAFYPNYQADNGYNRFNIFNRDYQTKQLDLSWSDKQDDWVAGIYLNHRETDLDRPNYFTNSYDFKNVALYGRHKFKASKQLSVSAGLRLEQFAIDYHDANGTTFEGDEVLMGGHFSAVNEYRDNFSVYVSISRSYKPGGVNGEALSDFQDPAVKDLQLLLLNQAEFEAETLDNFEMGIRGGTQNGQLRASANVFFATRDKMQVWHRATNQKALSLGNANRPVFIGYIANAAEGSNYGVETTLTYRPNYHVTLTAGFSVIDTEIRESSRIEFDPIRGEDVEVDVDGRAQAHAPGYQYFASGHWRLSDRIEASLTLTGKDKYYYSISHDQQAKAAHLVNASIKYVGDAVDITVWTRNLTDEEYGIRGLYFGNDPRQSYQPQAYEQLGEPMVIGVRLDYTF